MHKLKLIFILLSLLILIVSCADSNPNQISAINFNLDAAAPGVIVIKAVASDYSASSLVLVDPTNLNHQSGDFMVDKSDTAISCGKGVIYHIGRYQLDRVSQLDFRGRLNWQKSVRTQIDPASANPYQVVELDESRALVVRFASNKQAIIDRNTGEIIDWLDLTEFVGADSDGVVEASVAWVSEGIVHLILNRINRQGSRWQFDQPAIVVKYLINNELEYLTHYELSIRNVMSAGMKLADQYLFTSAGSLLDGLHRGLELIESNQSINVHDQRFIKLVKFNSDIYGLEYLDWGKNNLVRFHYHDQVEFRTLPFDSVAGVVDIAVSDMGLLILTAKKLYLFDGTKLSFVALDSALDATSLEFCSF
jgi:hypothetical protein